VSWYTVQGDHFLRNPGDVGELVAVWEMSENNQKLGNYQKSLVRGSCLLLSLHKGLYLHFVASCLHVYYAIKYDVGNRNSGESAAKSRGNFTIPGEWSLCPVVLVIL